MAVIEIKNDIVSSNKSISYVSQEVDSDEL